MRELIWETGASGWFYYEEIGHSIYITHNFKISYQSSKGFYAQNIFL